MSLIEKYKGKIIVLIPVFIMLLGVGLMLILSKYKEPNPKAVDVLTPKYVSAVPVKYQSSRTTLMAFGKVTSAQSINLVAEASGRLMGGKVALKKASRFAKNDLLFRIDNTDTKLNLHAQKSDFIHAVGAALPDFKIDYPNAYQAWDTYWQNLEVEKTLPVLPVTTSQKEKAFVASRKITSMYYAIKSAEEKLSKFNYFAPYAGSIADLKVEIGTVVAAGTPIGRIIRTDEMEAEIPVQADMIAWVEKGMAVSLYSQDKKMHWEGTVARISDFVDGNSQSVNVYVKVFPNATYKILEGLYLSAEFKTTMLHQVMSLSRKALVNNDKVFVVEAGKLKLKQITIHKLNHDTVLFSGLNEGDLLVNESLINAVEGNEVKVK